MTDDEIKHRLVEKLWGEPLRATIWEKDDARKGTMTDDEIRIAVAEELGIEVLISTSARGKMGRKKGWGDGDWKMLPDYPNDLNACHEMEKTLTNDEWQEYTPILAAINPCDNHQWRSCASATARQRCEAFLRVKGKWKEKPPEADRAE